MCTIHIRIDNKNNKLCVQCTPEQTIRIMNYVYNTHQNRQNRQ